MRIQRLSIDGYGRFSGLPLELAPGLQLIIGPNEQGKSTLRGFITDMLYGQKRSLSQRAYDECNELRLPWAQVQSYGGTLEYVLDSGQVIEIIRNFDRKRESVQVYDRTNAREITAAFELLKNREVDFASVHVGLTKDVFCGVASIGHFSLEDLGDGDALNQIREKLLTLADSSEESNSAEAALKLLRQRIIDIGAPTARTKPLPAAKSRLVELRAEYETAVSLQGELEGVARKRHGLTREIAQLRAQRLQREEELRQHEAHQASSRLREAEQLAAKINQVTQQCFGLGAVRDFPYQNAPELNRMETQINTARVQLQRTRKEQEQVLLQVKQERERLGAESADSPQDVPEEVETRLTALMSTEQHLRERLAETEQLVENAKHRLKEAQTAVANLPDFSRVSSDPVEWISQLSNSFSVALRAREDEVRLRARLRAEVEQKRAASRDGEELFRGCQDFSEQAREYELEKRVHQDHIQQRQATLGSLELAQEESAQEIPELYWLTGLCGVLIVAVAAAFIFTKNPAVMYGGAVGLLAILYFLYKIGNLKVRLRKIQQQAEETKGELERLDKVATGEPGLMEQMLEKAGAQTIRELEAIYDHYRMAMAELNAREEALAIQEEKAAEAEERVQVMLERLRSTFREVGESLKDEYEAQEATSRSIARYQEYREAKRRVTDSRSVLERHEAEQRRLGASLEKAREDLKAVETKIRQFMRHNRFDEEEQIPTLVAALRAYRDRMGGKREQRARVELLKEKVQALDRQVKAEEFELEKHEQQLSHLLAKAGMSSTKEWNETAEKARQYQELWSRRTSLEEQLAVLLQGQEMKQLREAVKTQGTLPTRPAAGVEEIREQIEQLGAQVDQLMKEEHHLHILMTQRSGGARSLNEIEEEKAALEQQAAELEREFEATTYAMTLIEEMARDKHARIAPRLAEKASGYFATITDGAYTELLISRDLTISVRIPQTNRMNEAPEKSLSKGTVDQLYLALRLALVQSMSDSAETIPMLLDDPFANYDDARLERTLHLLRDLGRTHQILLFTCREDVARAAELVEAPIIRLDAVSAAG